MVAPESPSRILIADDQPDVLEALRLLLKCEGYQIEAVKSPAAVLKAVEAREFFRDVSAQSAQTYDGDTKGA